MECVLEKLFVKNPFLRILVNYFVSEVFKAEL